MPLLRTATIEEIDNPDVARLRSNSGGFEPQPLGDGWCINTSLWVLSNNGPRQFWSQVGHGVSGAGNDLHLELRAIPYGRLLTTVLLKVKGTGHSTLPSGMPVGKLLSMNASTSTYSTAWTVVDSVTDSSGLAAYNAYHWLSMTPNIELQYNTRYAVALQGEYIDDASENLILEGITLSYAFTLI